MRRVVGVVGLVLVVTATAGLGLGAQGAGAAKGRGTTAALPVVVFETVKGTFEVEFYPNEAPKSVEYILALVRRNFYNGLRVHRVVPGFVAQFGDPLTRDMSKRSMWGSGGSGRTIGVAEIHPKRTHKLGAVALAYASSGGPTSADSQLYICLNGPARYTAIEGDYAVIGQVISGMDVVQKLQEPDLIRRATVKGPGRGAK